MKNILWVILVAVMVLGMVGCAAQEAPATDAEQPAAEQLAKDTGEEADEETGKVVADVEDGKDVDSILIAATGLQQDQFTNVLLSGYQDKADELGIEILLANSQLSLDKESEMVNNFLEADVDALIIEPVSPDASVAMAELAEKKGVPVFACAIPINSDLIFASSINDCIDLGSSTGKEALPFLEENFDKETSLKAALLAFDSSDPEGSEGRISGFQNEVTDFEIDYVARQDVDTDNAYQVVTDILTAHEDLNFIFAASENGLVGAYNAIKAADKSGEVLVFGVDCSAQICEMMLEDDIILATTAQSPYEQGAYAVETMFNYVVNGEEPAEKHLNLDGVLVTQNDEAGITEFKEMWESRAGSN